MNLLTPPTTTITCFKHRGHSFCRCRCRCNCQCHLFLIGKGKENLYIQLVEVVVTLTSRKVVTKQHLNPKQRGCRFDMQNLNSSWICHKHVFGNHFYTSDHYVGVRTLLRVLNYMSGYMIQEVAIC